MADAKIKIPRDYILRSSTLVLVKGMRARKSEGEIGGSSISGKTFGITAGLLVDLHYVTSWCFGFPSSCLPNGRQPFISQRAEGPTVFRVPRFPLRGFRVCGGLGAVPRGVIPKPWVQTPISAAVFDEPRIGDLAKGEDPGHAPAYRHRSHGSVWNWCGPLVADLLHALRCDELMEKACSYF